MAEVMFDDILEQVFVRLDVRDIIRCKRVCKSWYSFISCSGFVNSHLKHNNTSTIGRRRIVIQGYWKNNLVGSSNGLVCIFTSDPKLCILNPCTRELKTLKNLDFLDNNYRMPHLNGFGYDPSSDDYKVIVGKHQENSTRFYLLSLKSNVWKVVGDFDFDLGIGSSAGILCNGALHWLMRDQNHNTVILSFHLSKEEFEEIPTPANDRCEYTCHTHLGIIKESLCIFDDKKREHPKWVMKNYNDKQSWELLPHLLQWDKDITHDVKVLKLKSYYRAKTFFDHNLCLSKTLKYISAPVFVQSLVSPHVNKRRKRKRNVMANLKTSVVALCGVPNANASSSSGAVVNASASAGTSYGSRV